MPQLALYAVLAVIRRFCHYSFPANTGYTAVTDDSARCKTVDLFDRVYMCVREFSTGSICGRKPEFGTIGNFGN